MSQKSVQIKIIGQVQGVGFRPFIYRIAQQHKLTGWVKNCSGEVIVLAQGKQTQIQAFIDDIHHQHPPLAIPTVDTIEAIDSEQFDHFFIDKSATSETAERHIPPDYFTCDDCLDELTNPQERRYRYPFINCTQCGPRYTIIADLPYDRPNTSMADFPLCPDCHKEYTDTLDRRFHAQPLACAVCGPELTYIDDTAQLADNEAALTATITALKQGKVIAVKGVGGYHLICDAQNNQAVLNLRQRKHRPHKPLAVMFAIEGDNGLAQLTQFCSPTDLEAQVLKSPQRPIVLIKAKTEKLAAAIHPGLQEVGAFLAYSPLHYLILNDFGAPIVATSGNLSGEPVLTDNQQASIRLKPIVDAFLQHNRPILRPADDSVIRVIANKPRLFRIGRGLTPLEFNLPVQLKQPVLAVGGQMKNTIALGWNKRIIISPHIGELDNKRSIDVFAQVIDDLCHLYRVQPKTIICDAHPGYYSTQYAQRYAKDHDLSLIKVQHHRAHASMLSGEYGDEQPWLIFSWDGTGLGDDKSIWGGEGFYGQAGQWQRVCSIKPFYLQGGDKAAREPWRSACALLWETRQSNTQWPPTNEQVSLAHQAWLKRLNTIRCSSMGRLFDAASALLELGENSSFEGQGPMLLEALLLEAPLLKNSRTQRQATQAEQYLKPESLPLYEQDKLLLADWHPIVSILLDESYSREQKALYFHQTMAETLIAQAQQIKLTHGTCRIGLSGGVFQNKYLTNYLKQRLTQENFEFFLPEQIPYNDAGLAFGQIIEGSHQ